MYFKILIKFTIFTKFIFLVSLKNVFCCEMLFMNNGIYYAFY